MSKSTATTATTAASSSVEVSQWTVVPFRNLAPRSDVCVVTLPLEMTTTTTTSTRASSRRGLMDETKQKEAQDEQGQQQQSNNTEETMQKQRILHFIIGGEAREGATNGSSVVETIEWACRRSWKMASLQAPRTGCGAALLRGVIYTVGGLSDDSTVLASVEKYSFFKEEKRWEALSEKSNMKAARWGHAVVALPRKNAIFAIGGRNSSWQELSSVEVAQQSPTGALEWKRLPYGMRQKRFGAAVVALGDASFIVMGGYDGAAWTRTAVLYEVDGEDIRDGMWTDLSDMPRAVVFPKATVATIHGQEFVFVGGASEDGSSVLQVFVVKERFWAIMETNGGEEGCSLAVEDDCLLCIGGGSNKVRCLNLTFESQRGILGALCASAGAVVEVSAVAVEQPQQISVPSNNKGGTASSRALPVPSSPANRASRPEPEPNSGETSQPTRFVENMDCVVDGEPAKYSGGLNDAGQRQGKGVLIWANENGEFYPKALSKNSFYEGEFHEDFRRGKGTFFVKEEGRLYEGIFERGVLFGDGKLTDINRRLVYEGGFRKGMSSGEGRCHYQDTGRTFTGIWKRGRPLSGRLVEIDGREVQSGSGPWTVDLAVDLSRAGPNASTGPPRLGRPMNGIRPSSDAMAPSSTRAPLSRAPPPQHQVGAQNVIPQVQNTLAPTPESPPQQRNVFIPPQGGPPQQQNGYPHNGSPNFQNGSPQLQRALSQPRGGLSHPLGSLKQPPAKGSGSTYVENQQCNVDDEPALYSGSLNAAGQRHGRGFIIWADEEGQFHPKETKKNTYYMGQFYEDSRTGNGLMFVKEENRIYQGCFERGVLTGEGTLRDARRDIVYEGTFKKGTPHGEGKAIYGLSGRVFIGRWKKGQPIAGKLYNNRSELLQQGSAIGSVDLAID